MRGSIQQWYASLRSRARSRNQYEFLPAYLELMERPPSPTARVTAISITSIVLLTLLWTYFGELDIHVQASGELVLPSRTQEIQPYFAGEVVSIHVRNGQPVKAGDPLVVLNNVGSQQELRIYQEREEVQKLDIMCYQALLSGDPERYLADVAGRERSVAAKDRVYCLSMWRQHQADLAELDAELATNQADQVARQADVKLAKKIQVNIQQRLLAHRKLAASQALSRESLLKYEHEALMVERDLAKQQSEIELIKARLKGLQERRASIIARQHREWHGKLNEAAKILPEIEQSLDKAHEVGRLQTLRAPLDGFVQKLDVHTLGGVVQAGQKLMIITPKDAAQQAEVRIMNKDIGFIQVGSSVTIKVDAFPYSRYGTLEGTVLSVSRDAVHDRGIPEGAPPVFPAQVELQQNYIMVGDKKVMLTPGMSIIANIKVGKRRVIDYIFSPIREYQAEACREP